MYIIIGYKTAQMGWIHIFFSENSFFEYDYNDIISKEGKYVSVSDKGHKYNFFEVIYYIENDVNNSLIYWDEDIVKFKLPTYYKSGPVEIIFPYDTHLFVDFEQYQSIFNIYFQRAKKRQQERKQIEYYIDSSMLTIAENLVNSIDYETFFVNEILKHFYLYSGKITNSKDFDENKFPKVANLSSIKGLRGISNKTKRFAYYKEKLKSLLDYFLAFAKIIEEEKTVNEFLAKAIAWEAIRQVSIKLFSKQWQIDYGIFLPQDYDAIKKQELSENVQLMYIKSVLCCGDIPFEKAKGLLVYYLIDKSSDNIYDISEFFKKCEN